MVVQRRIVERLVLIGLVLTLGLSTGVASIAQPDFGATTGHTAYVTGEILVEPRPNPDATPLVYGLATHREERFFGLWAEERPTTPAQNRLVYVWSADAPDPRGDPDLAPTGSWGRVIDRLGHLWTIHEYRYGPADAPHHAYAVALGPVRDAGEPQVGDDPDRLRLQTGVGRAPPATHE